jgi:2'-5' RNA ligase
MNCFALVAYIPDPLGAFLDRLRQELVPGYVSHAHVTVLPPRPLFVAPRSAASEIASRLPLIAPFEVEATEVEIFPRTSVIYLAVGVGRPELHRLHDALNDGALEFQEPFFYHPHITLAQELPADQVPEGCQRARRFWAGFPGSRRFTVEAITLVQNAVDNDWIDLAEYRLGRSSERRARSE